MYTKTLNIYLPIFFIILKCFGKAQIIRLTTVLYSLKIDIFCRNIIFFNKNIEITNKTAKCVTPKSVSIENNRIPTF